VGDVHLFYRNEFFMPSLKYPTDACEEDCVTGRSHVHDIQRIVELNFIVTNPRVTILVLRNN
jgi:hypothetical protein